MSDMVGKEDGAKAEILLSELDKLDEKELELRVDGAIKARSWGLKLRLLYGWLVNSEVKIDKVLIDNSVRQQLNRGFVSIVKKQRSTWPYSEEEVREKELRGEEMSVSVMDLNPVFDFSSCKNEDILRSMLYIPGILFDIKRGRIKAYDSDVLAAESAHHKLRAISGAAWGAKNWFREVGIENLDGYEAFCHCRDDLEYSGGSISPNPEFKEKSLRELTKEKMGKEGDDYEGIIITSEDRDPFGVSLNSERRLTELLKERSRKDLEYARIAKCLRDVSVKDENLRDSWHLYTAEAYRLDYFLTVDLKFRKRVEEVKSSKVMRDMTVKVVTPEELGKKLGVVPMSEKEFSHFYRNSVLSKS